MSVETLILFIALVGIGAYIHTVSGFALGMIVMGAVAALDAAPVPLVAAVVSLITLVNGAFALPGALHHIYWRGTMAAIVGVLPSTVIGVLLLDHLSSTASHILRLLLGIAIVSGGLHIVLVTSRRTSCSGRAGFFVSGVFGGLFGGLFSVPGPPLIYHFYRQPLTLATIRNSLLLSFTVIQAARTLFVGTQGQLTTEVWVLTLTSVPAVALATLAGRYFPPPLGEVGMNRLVFVALLLIGGSLIVEGASRLI